MSITRRKFCGAMAGGTVLLLMQSCGAGDDDADKPAASSCGASGAAISLNHGHTLVIPLVDLDSIGRHDLQQPRLIGP
jgi:hypothetical protein